MRRAGVSLDNSSIALNLIDQASEIVAKYVEKNKRTAGYRLFRLSRSRDEILRIMDGTSRANTAGPVQGDLFEMPQ